VVTDLPNLHDSILNSIHLDWESGDLRVQIEGHDFDLAVLAYSLTSLECPRHHPWGPSFYIKNAILEDGNGSESLTIEMQSGDLIKIEAKRLSFDKTAHNKR
jgi:hypothetical protein